MRFCRLAPDARGASLVEYVVVVGLVAITALGAFRYFGARVHEKIDAQAACVETLDCQVMPADAALGESGSAPAAPAARGIGPRMAAATSKVASTPEAAAGRAAAAVERAMVDGPASGARALREQLEAITDPRTRQLLVQATADEVQAISAEVNKNWELNMHYDDADVAAEFEERLFSKDLPKSKKLHPTRAGKGESIKRWLGDQIAG